MRLPRHSRVLLALGGIVLCAVCAMALGVYAYAQLHPVSPRIGNEFDVQAETLLRVAGWLLLALILLALYLGRVIHQSLTTPLQHLIQGSEEIASGKLTHHIDIRKDASGFAAVANQLHRLAEQLQTVQADKSRHEEQEHELRVVLESLHDYAIFVTDTEGFIVNWYTQSAGVFGYHIDEVRGDSFARLFQAREDARNFRDEALAAIKARGRHECDARLVRRDGSEFDGNIVATPLVSHGNHIGYCVVARDVTRWRNAERHIAQLATRDPLTGLRNRGALMEELKLAISRSNRTPGRFALIFIDLDYFKEVNDKYGHVAGDALLTTIASRLTDCVRDIDVVARLGGDEFLVLMTDVEDAASIRPVAERMLQSLSAPLNLLGHHVQTSASMGICLYPDDGTDITTLMKNADIAMYSAKEAQRNNFQFFETEMNARVQSRLQLQQELRIAAAEHQFELYFQPQVAVESGAIEGVEALLRWRHPTRGLVPPAQFIPLLEEIRLMQTVGQWVIDEACRKVKAWNDQGLKIGYVAVNISAAQLNSTLVDQVRNALASTGIEPRWLMLEITESVLIEQLDETIAILHRLRALGLRVAMDDFGTGYSSLSALQRLPLDTLKIDRGFLSPIGDEGGGNDNDRAAAIIAAVVAIARELEMSVVAEGVETHTQLAYLRTLQCDAYQGYLHSMPMDEVALQALVASPLSVMEDAQGRALTLTAKVTIELPLQ